MDYWKTLLFVSDIWKLTTPSAGYALKNKTETTRATLRVVNNYVKLLKVVQNDTVEYIGIGKCISSSVTFPCQLKWDKKQKNL